jgi:hypothetical protein
VNRRLSRGIRRAGRRRRVARPAVPAQQLLPEDPDLGRGIKSPTDLVATPDVDDRDLDLDLAAVHAQEQEDGLAEVA